LSKNLFVRPQNLTTTIFIFDQNIHFFAKNFREMEILAKKCIFLVKNENCGQNRTFCQKSLVKKKILIKKIQSRIKKI